MQTKNLFAKHDQWYRNERACIVKHLSKLHSPGTDIEQAFKYDFITAWQTFAYVLLLALYAFLIMLSFL